MAGLLATEADSDIFAYGLKATVVKKGFPWLWIIIIILILGGVAAYFMM